MTYMLPKLLHCSFNSLSTNEYHKVPLNTDSLNKISLSEDHITFKLNMLYHTFIIKVNAVITPGNEHLVHHMELFHCTSPGSDVDMRYSGNCNDPSKPKETHGCSKVTAAWSFGAQVLIIMEKLKVP